MLRVAFCLIGSLSLGCQLVASYEAATAVRDLARDGAGDGAIGDGVSDGASDVPDADVTITCSPPATVGSAPPVVGLINPALRASGLQLVAFAPNGGTDYVSTRAAVGAAFGSWRAGTLRLASTADPSFINISSSERVAIATPSGVTPRRLELCQVISNTVTGCDPIVVQSSATDLTTRDLDGPHFVNEQLLVFNENLLASGTGASIWLATGSVGARTPFIAEEIIPAEPGVLKGDPAAVVDGAQRLIVVYETRATPGADQNLAVWIRAPGGATSSRLLSEVNDVGNEREPELKYLSTDMVELFFARNLELLRSECRIQ